MPEWLDITAIVALVTAIGGIIAIWVQARRNKADAIKMINESYKDLCDQLRNRIDQLHQDISQSDMQIDTLRRDVKEAKDRITALEDENRELKHALATSERERCRLQGEVDELSERLAAYEKQTDAHNPAEDYQMIDLRLGDCLEVMKTLPDKSVDAVITDPPYGISYQSAWRIDKAERFDVIAGDSALDFAWVDEAWRLLKDATSIMVFCRWDVQDVFLSALATRFTVRSQVIWDRGVHGLGDLKAQYAPCHDVLWFATKGSFSFPNGRPKSVYRIDRLSADKLLHPTQKPTSLMKVIIEDLTVSGSVVLDPFAGSGTTLVACAQMDRGGIGIEIDPGYFEIAKKRIEEAQLQIMMPL